MRILLISICLFVQSLYFGGDLKDNKLLTAEDLNRDQLYKKNPDLLSGSSHNAKKKTPEKSTKEKLDTPKVDGSPALEQTKKISSELRKEQLLEATKKSKAVEQKKPKSTSKQAHKTDNRRIPQFLTHKNRVQ